MIVPVHKILERILVCYLTPTANMLIENEKLRHLLTQAVASQGIERGLYYFTEGFYSNQRISPETVFGLRQYFTYLAAQLILEHPTGGLVGVLGESQQERWIPEIASELENRGFELPTSEVYMNGEVVSGIPLSEYPRNSKVTIFSNINTLGGYLSNVRRVVEGQGLRVHQAISLIDRHPNPTQVIDSDLPFFSAVHLPLPLYTQSEFVPGNSELRRFGHDAKYRCFWLSS
jgi:hypothetical protein